VPTELVIDYVSLILDSKSFQSHGIELLFGSNIKNGIDGHILINYRKSNDNNRVKNLFYGFIDN
jgi:hypothetical protein